MSGRKEVPRVKAQVLRVRSRDQHDYVIHLDLEKPLEKQPNKGGKVVPFPQKKPPAK